MVLWDLISGTPVSRFRCHPGPITAIEVIGEGGDEDGHGSSVLIVTAGADGYVKLWDPRASGSGMVQKIPAHVRFSTSRNTPLSSSLSSSSAPRHKSGVTTHNGGTGSGRGASAALKPSQQPTGNTATASAIGCLVAVRNGVGSSSACPYLITGAGGGPGGGDSSIALIDIRHGSTDNGSDQIVTRWEHQQNGVYSMCLVGNECLLSGDGMGNLVAHEVLASGDSSPLRINAASASVRSSAPSTGGQSIHKQAWCDDFATGSSTTSSRSSTNQRSAALEGGSAAASGCMYGIVASERGAVRSINALNNKVVACGEDGNVLIFEYKDIGR